MDVCTYVCMHAYMYVYCTCTYTYVYAHMVLYIRMYVFRAYIPYVQVHNYTTYIASINQVEGRGESGGGAGWEGRQREA